MKLIILSTASVALISMSLAGSANAALLGRLAATPGGTDYQAYYDEDSNLTWVADANLAKTSGFDDDGLMTWQNAKDWAANLDIDGVTGWRLPTTMQPDSSCSNQSDVGVGIPSVGSGTGCTGSEMGHLYNVDGITTIVPGPFSNVQFDIYWSGTEFAQGTDQAWIFRFEDGLQAATAEGSGYYGWAVQLGDVSSTVPGPGTVPVPAAVWLFGSGLLGLVGIARRRHITPHS